jgi:hypothetical protein
MNINEVAPRIKSIVRAKDQFPYPDNSMYKKILRATNTRPGVKRDEGWTKEWKHKWWDVAVALQEVLNESSRHK